MVRTEGVLHRRCARASEALEVLAVLEALEILAVLVLRRMRTSALPPAAPSATLPPDVSPIPVSRFFCANLCSTLEFTHFLKAE